MDPPSKVQQAVNGNGLGRPRDDVIEALAVVVDKDRGADVSLMWKPVRHTDDRSILLLIVEHGRTRERRRRWRHEIVRRIWRPMIVSKQGFPRRVVRPRKSRRRPDRVPVARNSGCGGGG